MSKTNSEIMNIMFEEINEKLQHIQKTIQLNRKHSDTPCNYTKQDIEQALQGSTNSLLSSINKSIQNSSNSIINHINNKHQDIASLALPETKTIFAKKTRILAYIAIIIIMGISVMANLKLYKENIQLYHTDLKYRYIKASNGINENKLLQLEELFKNSNAEKIKSFEDYVKRLEKH